MLPATAASKRLRTTALPVPIWNAPVCTVGCYEQSDTESYMAAGVTDPAWQGRGLARYLIVGLANELTAERAVRFACFPALCGFYAQLGFLQIGKIQHYTTDWNTT